MAKLSDAEFASALFAEQASTPTTPASGFGRIFIKSDGVYFVDDAGIETGPFAESAPGASDKVVAYKTANESVTSSTTLQNDDHLLFAVAANEVWVARFYLIGNAATTGDVKIAWTVPAGATLLWNAHGLGEGVTSIEGAHKFAGSSSSGAAQTFGGSGFTFGIHGSIYVANGSTAGNVQLQWAQGTSSGTATTMFAGSHLVADLAS